MIVRLWRTLGCLCRQGSARPRGGEIHPARPAVTGRLYVDGQDMTDALAQVYGERAV